MESEPDAIQLINYHQSVDEENCNSLPLCPRQSTILKKLLGAAAPRISKRSSLPCLSIGSYLRQY